MLSFLTKKFGENVSYGTLNTHRSAISLISGNNLGEDPEVSRFFKGIFRQKPPKAKYNLTWDTNIVLDYLRNLNLELDQKSPKITRKLCMLLALGTAQRAQTLSLIRLENIRFDTKGVTIMIDEVTKTSSINNPNPILYLPFFVQDENICIARCLKYYINLTREIRNDVKQLFLSINKPHKAITSQTISRWLKEVLSKSGIDTSIFSGHSTRHASTSKVKELGINLDVIRKTAG